MASYRACRARTRRGLATAEAFDERTHATAAVTARPEREGDPRPDGTARPRDDPGDDGAATAAVRARPALHLQHRDGADGDDGRRLHGAAARLRRLSRGHPPDDAAA